MPLPGPVLYAGAIWLGAYPDNFMGGRQGNAVQGILDHHSASTLDGLVARFTTSSGVSGGGVSAHFAIDRDGTRYQFVDTDDTAFHAGNFPANLTKIGIEHVRLWGSGPGTPGYEPITDAQYQSSHELHAILSRDKGFPLDLTCVEPHNHYTQTTCPGDLDLNRILQGEDMTPDESAKLARLDLYWYDDGSGGGGTLTKAFMSRFAQIDTEIAALKAGGVKTDETAVLAAIADLKAHPDPTAAAIGARIEAALKQA